MQLRDFIYVKDLISVLYFLMGTRENSGIYNLGTGKGSSVLEVIRAFEEVSGQKLKCPA